MNKTLFAFIESVADELGISAIDYQEMHMIEFEYETNTEMGSDNVFVVSYGTDESFESQYNTFIEDLQDFVAGYVAEDAAREWIVNDKDEKYTIMQILTECQTIEEHYNEFLDNIMQHLKYVSGLTGDEPVFEYGNFHFIDLKDDTPSQMGFHEAISHTNWVKGPWFRFDNCGDFGGTPLPWSYDDFYQIANQSAGGKAHDIFLCVETGNRYVPSCNNLFEWVD